MAETIFANAHGKIAAPNVNQSALDSLEWSPTNDADVIRAWLPAQDSRPRLQRACFLHAVNEAMITTLGNEFTAGFTAVFLLRGEASNASDTFRAVSTFILPPKESIEWIVTGGTLLVAITPGNFSGERSPIAKYDLNQFIGPMALAPGADADAGTLPSGSDEIARIRTPDMQGVLVRSRPTGAIERYTVGVGGAFTLVLHGAGGFGHKGEDFAPGQIFVASSKTPVDFTMPHEMVQMGFAFGRPSR